MINERIEVTFSLTMNGEGGSSLTVYDSQPLESARNLSRRILNSVQKVKSRGGNGIEFSLRSARVKLI